LEAATRFELVNNGFADRCLSHLATPPVILKRPILTKPYLQGKGKDASAAAGGRADACPFQPPAGNLATERQHCRMSPPNLLGTHFPSPIRDIYKSVRLGYLELRLLSEFTLLFHSMETT
jgi:hypothetical protein